MAEEWDVFALAPGSGTVTLATSAAADDIIDTAAAHGFAAGDQVMFSTLTGGAGLTEGTTYYVIAANLAATTFQVSTTAGGSAALFTTDITAGVVAAAPTLLATLYNAREKSIRVELNAAGSGSFAINRTSPECTETILAQGNLVKVRIPEISAEYLFAFFLETGDFTLISSDEEGGEMLHFGGRGNLTYLHNAVAWSESFFPAGADPQAGLWRAFAFGGGGEPGAILWRTVMEFMQATRPQHPVPLLTIDFDDNLDSDGNAWTDTDATAEFTYAVGDHGDDILQRLIETEVLTVWMGPDFDFHAYNSFGRDLTGAAFGAGVVRFERGVNIAVELRRELTTDEVVTHNLVSGEADKYATASLADAASRVTKEGYVAAYGETTTPLAAIGADDLQKRLNKSDLITFPIANRRTTLSLADPVTVGAVKATPGLGAAGYYLPGPAGTNGDFWLGDTVRVHTGYMAFDYTEVDAVVQAITITREDDNAELIVIPELKTVPTPAAVEQYFTHTTSGGCETGTYPQPPGEGNTLIGIAAQRSTSTNYGAGAVPIGNTAVAGTCNDVLDVTGTDYVYITGIGPSYAMTMASRHPSIASEPQTIRWGGVAGFAGSAGTRSHQVEISGLSGVVESAVTASGFSGGDPGTVFVSPDVVASSAGFCIWGFTRSAPGPADGATASYEMTARSPAQVLTQGYAFGGFAPNSCLVILRVETADTYNCTLDMSATPRDPGNPWRWVGAFFPDA